MALAIGGSATYNVLQQQFQGAEKASQARIAADVVVNPIPLPVQSPARDTHRIASRSRRMPQPLDTLKPTQTTQSEGSKQYWFGSDHWKANLHTERERSNARLMFVLAKHQPWFSYEQVGCLDNLWAKESDFNEHSSNPSGAYGIPQALPGAKMSEAGADWRTNPETQMKWGFGYIEDRYGIPCKAWQHSIDHNWY